MADADPLHFDGVAQSYAEARPAYPAELWRDVLATGLATPGRRALDIGAGTGEATGELLAHGMDVVAVEPGPRLAELLAERHPRAVVIRSRAEELRLEAASFDLVVAATSIHWRQTAPPFVEKSRASSSVAAPRGLETRKTSMRRPRS